MPHDSETFTRTQTHESPSHHQAECLVQPPATGLRLPRRRSESETLHVASRREAGGEHPQGTTAGPAEASPTREPAAAGGRLGTSRINEPHDAQQARRRLRYARRQQSSTWLIGAAREAAGLPRTSGPESSEWVRPARPARCRWRAAEVVGVHHTTGRSAHWSGIERCASIWACPVCSAIIRNERAREIQEAADRWATVGGSVVMVTLTTRHYLGDALGVTLDQALTSWAKMMRHRRWRALKQRLQVSGYVRAVEVTWGQVNGWHPHIHALLFLDGTSTDAQLSALQAEIFDLWSTVLASVGARTVSRANGVRVSRGGSAEYVAKVQEHDRGTGLEMARLDLKNGRAGSLMPFELLDENRHRRRWVEYVTATHGRRAITWSRGLRTLLGLDVEKTDEEVMAETETSDLVEQIPGGEYDRIKNNPGALAAVLERHEGAKDAEGLEEDATESSATGRSVRRLSGTARCRAGRSDDARGEGGDLLGVLSGTGVDHPRLHDEDRR